MGQSVFAIEGSKGGQEGTNITAYLLNHDLLKVILVKQNYP